MIIKSHAFVKWLVIATPPTPNYSLICTPIKLPHGQAMFRFTTVYRLAVHAVITMIDLLKFVRFELKG